MLLEASQAARSLLKRPVFTVVAVLSIALGIGAVTAIFSLIDRSLLTPLPFHAASRLVVLTTENDATNRGGYLSLPDFREYRDQLKSIDALCALRTVRHAVGLGDELESILGAQVSPEFFGVIGAPVVLGRAFVPADGEGGAAPVAILTDALWRRKYGADPAAIGRTVTIGGRPTQIIGVLPPSFFFAYRIQSAQIFTPLDVNDPKAARGSRDVYCIARLTTAAQFAACAAEAQQVAAALAQQYPATNQGLTAQAMSIHQAVNGGAKQAMALAMLAAILVLLAACANLAALFWAKYLSRTDELAIRSALGATRAAIARVLLYEPALVSLVGAVAGAWLAFAFSRALELQLGLHPVVSGSPVNLRALLFTFAVLVVAVAFISLPPIVASLRIMNVPGSGKTAPERRGKPYLRQGLVAIEVAVAVVIGLCTARVVGSLVTLLRIDTGLQLERAVALRLPLRSTGNDSVQRANDLRAIAEQVRNVPGIEAAGITNSLPLDGSFGTAQYLIPNQSPQEAVKQTAIYAQITPGLLRGLGIQLKIGRDVSEADAVLINEHLARRHWPDGNAVGQKISVQGPQGPWCVIGGVVSDTRHRGFRDAVSDVIYFSVSNNPPWMRGNLVLVYVPVGSSLGPTDAIKRIVSSVDPTARLRSPFPLVDLVRREIDGPRHMAIVFLILAATSILLVAVGVYGVSHFTTTQRTRECAIRLALGASGRSVTLLLFRQNMSAVALGAAVGVGANIMVSHALAQRAGWLSSPSFLASASSIAGIGIIAAIACILPVRGIAKLRIAAVLKAD